MSIINISNSSSISNSVIAGNNVVTVNGIRIDVTGSGDTRDIRLTPPDGMQVAICRREDGGVHILLRRIGDMPVKGKRHVAPDGSLVKVVDYEWDEAGNLKVLADNGVTIPWA